MASDILPEASGIQLLFAWSPKVITNGLCTLFLFVVQGKTSKQSPSSSLKNTKEKGITFNTTLQKKHTSKIIIISIDKKPPRVPHSSFIILVCFCPGSPPEGLFLFMASHSTSMFPINVSTAWLKCQLWKVEIGRLGDLWPGGKHWKKSLLWKCWYMSYTIYWYQ